MIDTATPQGEWLQRLGTALMDRRNGRRGRVRWNQQTIRSNRVRPPIDLLEAYFSGDPPLQQVAGEWQGYVREFIRKGRLNIADLLVSSTANRMQLRDFRTAAADDEMGDERARDIMRANDLALKFREVHEGMLSLGDAYTITTPPDEKRKYPLITAESATQVITADDPATGETIAGLKMFRDDWDSADLAYVYLPGKVFRAIKKGPTSISRSLWRLDTKGWVWDDRSEQDVPGSELPVVHYRNRLGVGEFENHLGSLDRINDKIANEWWIGKIQAFRQRAVKNLPDEDEHGNEIDYTDVFVADPGAMWQMPEGAEFWESTPVDLTPVTNSIKHDLERLAAATSTMLHTITPDAAAGSAEGASLMREEHNFKVEDRRDRASGRHARTLSLAFKFAGEAERADITKLEPIWGPVERYSLQEKASAAASLRNGLPSEAIWTDVLQYPPAEIPNLRTLRARELLFQAAGQPPAR